MLMAKKKSSRRNVRRLSLVEAAGALATLYQAGKVGYGNYSWIDNVKENPVQPFTNVIGISGGSFSLPTLIETDAPFAAGVIIEKVLKWAGFRVNFGKKLKL